MQLFNLLATLLLLELITQSCLSIRKLKLPNGPVRAVKAMMYGYGDAEQPIPSTVDLVEVAGCWRAVSAFYTCPAFFGKSLRCNAVRVYLRALCSVGIADQSSGSCLTAAAIVRRTLLWTMSP